MSGCAQHVSKQQKIGDNWRLQLKEQKNWQARGKAAFISADDRQSVNFNWQLINGRQHLILSRFIGTQLLELIEHEAHSEAAYQDEHFHAQNSSELIARLSGFQLPFEQAPLWLTGVIDTTHAEYDPKFRLNKADWIDEQGKKWTVLYQSYQLVDGYWLPKRMSLSHSTLKIKIQLNSWQFTNE